MPLLVQLGAGAIGRGFIAPLFAGAGWQVALLDADRVLVEELARRRSYLLTEIGESGERRIKVPVHAALHVADPACAELLAACDLAASAVGLANLPRLGGLLADALARRTRPLDLLLCENGAEAPQRLRAAVAAPAGAAGLGIVRCSIGRMVPVPGRGADLRAEAWHHLPVARRDFLGPPPEVPGLEPADDFALVASQKLHLHNLTHACLAYGGARRGLALIADCAADPALAAAARAAGAEVAEALGRRHGPAARASSLALLDGLMRRYRLRALGDQVARVGRDPWRKLAADDRLLGAARLCLAEGVEPRAIAGAIADACAWRIADDEPGAGRWRSLQPGGPAALLAGTITTEDPLMTLIDLAQQRRAAAARLEAAGVQLLAEEEARLEIADFGLGRFDEFGLAIHVYVNTSRCCAKELAMLPGQVCPEHRHPPVDGDPGKEETFRVRSGLIHLFLPGPGDRQSAAALLPADKRGTVSALRRVTLHPGEQCTLPPDTPHWFAAGPEGAVVSEFSTRSRDEADVFLDPAIRRVG